MAKTEQKVQAPMVGGSSLLVIFAVLCLTVFALLGFSTVQADRRLEQVSVQAVEDYYAADAQAEKILAQLRSGQMPEGVQLQDGIYSFRCKISDTQEIQVEVRAADWDVLSWQSVSTTDWTESASLQVWDGES